MSGSGVARGPWLAVTRSALLLAGLVAAGWTLQRISGLDTQTLARDLRTGGPVGWIMFVTGAALAGAVGMPRQVLSFVAGYGFGAALGGALALVAAAIACAVDFAWARLVAQDWTQRHVLPRFSARLGRIDGFLSAHPFSTTLIVRLLPVGHNLGFTLLGGLSSAPALPFIAASILGYTPQTVVFALLGSGAGLGNRLQIAIGVGLFAAAALLGVWLYRRHRAEAIALAADQ